jgi:hypothetical protein
VGWRGVGVVGGRLRIRDALELDRTTPIALSNEAGRAHNRRGQPSRH